MIVWCLYFQHYYKEDFGDGFIEGMKIYLNESKILKLYSKKTIGLENRLDTMNIRGNLKNEIVLLSIDDEAMRKVIDMDWECANKVRFDYMDALGIRRCVRERCKYNKLTEVLGKIK